MIKIIIKSKGRKKEVIQTNGYILAAVDIDASGVRCLSESNLTSVPSVALAVSAQELGEDLLQDVRQADGVKEEWIKETIERVKTRATEAKDAE